MWINSFKVILVIMMYHVAASQHHLENKTTGVKTAPNLEIPLCMRTIILRSPTTTAPCTLLCILIICRLHSKCWNSDHPVCFWRGPNTKCWGEVTGFYFKPFMGFWLSMNPHTPWLFAHLIPEHYWMILWGNSFACDRLQASVTVIKGWLSKNWNPTERVVLFK